MGGSGVLVFDVTLGRCRNCKAKVTPQLCVADHCGKGVETRGMLKREICKQNIEGKFFLINKTPRKSLRQELRMNVQGF